MESQPQNPEFRNNPENFHPCITVQNVRPDLDPNCLALKVFLKDLLTMLILKEQKSQDCKIF